MKEKTYLGISGVIFLIIALLHLWRAIAAWPAAINNLNIPVWLSWIAFLIAGYLSFTAWHLMKK